MAASKSVYPRSPYEALNSNAKEIRLFVLLPGTTGKPILSQLRLAPFGGWPSIRIGSYEALSYTWGSPDVTYRILVNGIPFHIRQNLYWALLKLRLPHTERVLWIDAICSKNDTRSGSSSFHLKLPVWRWVDEHDKAPSSLERDDILETIEIDSSKYLSSSHSVHVTSTQPESRAVSPLTEFWLVPRFKWGEFEVVSYCWESEVREREIVINQEVLEVPKNLEALLQRIRRLPDAKSGMKFWIDALCT